MNEYIKSDDGKGRTSRFEGILKVLVKTTGCKIIKSFNRF
jgi:hypothetical protein